MEATVSATTLNVLPALTGAECASRGGALQVNARFVVRQELECRVHDLP
jgi:hypothetical protein